MPKVRHPKHNLPDKHNPLKMQAAWLAQHPGATIEDFDRFVSKLPYLHGLVLDGQGQCHYVRFSKERR